MAAGAVTEELSGIINKVTCHTTHVNRFLATNHINLSLIIQAEQLREWHVLVEWVLIMSVCMTDSSVGHIITGMRVL